MATTANSNIPQQYRDRDIPQEYLDSQWKLAESQLGSKDTQNSLKSIEQIIANLEMVTSSGKLMVTSSEQSYNKEEYTYLLNKNDIHKYEVVVEKVKKMKENIISETSQSAQALSNDMSTTNTVIPPVNARQTPTTSVETEIKNALKTEVPADFAAEAKEFQIESRAKIREIIPPKHGNPDNWKRALDFIERLSDFNFEGANSQDFAWFDEKERAIFKNQLPAIQGMVGAAFLDEMYSKGYLVLPAGDSVELAAREGSTVSDVPLANATLQARTKASPNLAKALRAGLLFHSGDIAKYSYMYADKNGTISGDNLKYENFRQFLQYSDTTPAASLKKSNAVFSDAEFAEYLKAAQYVPSISNAINEIKALSKNPYIDANLETIAKSLETEGVNGGGKKGANTQAITDNASARNNDSSPLFPRKKTDIVDFQNDLKEAPVSTALSHLGQITMESLGSVFSSPASILGAFVALFAGRLITGKWSTPFTWLAVGTLTLGAYNHFGDLFENKDKNKNTTSDSDNKPMENAEQQAAGTIKQQQEASFGTVADTRITPE